jgi:hypothetical protein
MDEGNESWGLTMADGARSGLNPPSNGATGGPIRPPFAKILGIYLLILVLQHHDWPRCAAGEKKKQDLLGLMTGILEEHRALLTPSI